MNLIAFAIQFLGMQMAAVIKVLRNRSLFSQPSEFRSVSNARSEFSHLDVEEDAIKDTYFAIIGVFAINTRICTSAQMCVLIAYNYYASNAKQYKKESLVVH